MTDDERATYRRELRARCRAIHGHGTPDAVAELAAVAEWCREHEVRQDVYGNGGLIEEFEAKVAGLFGKPAARFMPSGTLAQGAAMRVWCGPSGRFGMHPTSHLELHEQRGYAELYGLRATLVGPTEREMLPDDLAAVAEPLDALLVELPTRENGGRLPEWDALVELCDLARERGTRLHLDGARVWEAQAAYDRPFEELAGLFDSVYVSFYKGIGALPGAMLLGPEDFVAEARLWQRRAGGNLYTLLPNVASAARQFDDRLARFPAYLERARALADALRPVEGVHVLPDPPHTNLFHVELDLSPETAATARDRVAEATGLWLFGGARPRRNPDRSYFELYVGDALMDIADEDVSAAFRRIFSF